MNKLLGKCSLLGALLAPFSLSAILLPINNHSFEATVIADGTFNTNSGSGPSGWGWSVFGTLSESPTRHVGVLNPNGTTLYPAGAPDGNNVGVVFLDGPASGDAAGLEQTLSTGLQLNQTYTLTVDVGNIGNDINFPHNQFNFTDFPGYRLELLAGNTLLVSEEDAVVPTEGTFVERSITITTTLAEHGSLVNDNLRIRLINQNAGPGIEVNFDNVRLDATAVPEPNQIALLLSVSALIYFRRKKFQQ